jgi:hypothetical protein
MCRSVNWRLVWLDPEGARRERGDLGRWGLQGEVVLSGRVDVGCERGRSLNGDRRRILGANCAPCAPEDLVVNNVGCEGALLSRECAVDHHDADAAALSDAGHSNIELAVGEARLG